MNSFYSYDDDFLIANTKNQLKGLKMGLQRNLNDYKITQILPEFKKRYFEVPYLNFLILKPLLQKKLATANYKVYLPDFQEFNTLSNDCILLFAELIQLKKNNLLLLFNKVEDGSGSLPQEYGYNEVFFCYQFINFYKNTMKAMQIEPILPNEKKLLENQKLEKLKIAEYLKPIFEKLNQEDQKKIIESVFNIKNDIDTEDNIEGLYIGFPTNFVCTTINTLRHELKFGKESRIPLAEFFSRQIRQKGDSGRDIYHSYPQLYSKI